MDGNIGPDIRGMTEGVECLRSLTRVLYDLYTLPPHYNRQYLLCDVIAEAVYK